MSRHRLSLLSVLLPSIALAATLGSTNPALVAEVAARHALLPGTQLSKAERKQKAALDRADVALAHDGATLANTLHDARTLVRVLDAAFSGDATFDALLSSLVSSLTTGVQARLATLAAGRDALAAGKTKTRVSKKIDKATAAVAGVAGASTRAGALKLLSKAATQVVAGERALGSPGPGGGPTTTDFMMDVGNPPTDHVSYPSTPPGILDHYTTVASGGGAGVFTLSAGANGTSGTTYSIMFFVVAPAVGDRPMTVTGSSLATIPGDSSFLTSGIVHFTAFDPAQHKCAGTFTATFGTTAVSGTFSSIEMVTG